MVPVSSPTRAGEMSMDSQISDLVMEGGVDEGRDQGLVAPGSVAALLKDAQLVDSGPGEAVVTGSEVLVCGVGASLSSPSLAATVTDGVVEVEMEAVESSREMSKAPATYSWAHKRKEKLLSVRKSSRHSKASVNISALEKAKRLTADKNLDSGTPKSTTLTSLPDSRLASVLEDSCIIFNPSRGSPSEILDLVRSRELSQASIAAAALRREQEETLVAAREAAEQAVVTEAGSSAQGGPNGEVPPVRRIPKRACAKRPMLSTRKGRGKRAGLP
jgi:hypothetical protein